MAGILLSLILFFQGIPTPQGGTVKGVLRDSAGSPLPGVRMGAVARPDSLETLVEGTAMAGIAQTDGDGRYTLENIPPGRYVIASVQTVMYGTTDVTRGAFRLSPPPFPSIPSLLSITLSAKPAIGGSGARVTGSVGDIGKRNIYMSGKPGVVYADGTFEFRDVVPGLHVIATVNNPSLPRAAIVSVGDTDVSGIQLKETVLLPPDIRDPKDPLPAGNHAPGTTIPLPRVSGVVLEESTKEPLRGELVLKSGDFLRTFPIDENGRFEAFSLVPGTYDIRFEIFGHATLGPSLVIEDKDVKLELTSRRLY